VEKKTVRNDCDRVPTRFRLFSQPDCGVEVAVVARDDLIWSDGIVFSNVDLYAARLPVSEIANRKPKKKKKLRPYVRRATIRHADGTDENKYYRDTKDDQIIATIIITRVLTKSHCAHVLLRGLLRHFTCIKYHIIVVLCTYTLLGAVPTSPPPANSVPVRPWPTWNYDDSDTTTGGKTINFGGIKIRMKKLMRRYEWNTIHFFFFLYRQQDYCAFNVGPRAIFFFTKNINAFAYAWRSASSARANAVVVIRFCALVTWIMLFSFSHGATISRCRSGSHLNPYGFMMYYVWCIKY
jgi:hypothetical protein